MDRLPHRKNIRLENHDYSQEGHYFITICTKDRKNMFWPVGATFGLPSPQGQDDEHDNVGATFGSFSPKGEDDGHNNVGATLGRPLSKIGDIVDSEINNINKIYDSVEINKYVIMPNHIHMIIILGSDSGRSKTAPTISRIIQQFKGSISKKVGFSIWQKSFHDHIIRNEHEYQEIWQYIETNPLKWAEDEYYI
ncbi:MAG: transposase [Clostridiales bacterium]|nr:transposase [Clostridiales bacterium]